VLSDTPAHREQAGEAAIYVNASSTESVAAGVRAALCDARRDDRIRTGRAIAEAATPMRQATKLAEVYDRVLAGASA
jgi:hypothetical protein